MTESPRRAAIYSRISLDRDGTKEGPERQELECRRYAAAREWRVVGVYEDRDLSAYSGKARPEYDRMMADVAAGRIDIVLVWKLDRLTRQGLVGITPLLEALGTAGARLVSTTENIDTTTAMGEGVLGMLASMAKQESENIGLRVRAAHASAASKGRAHSGGSRQFGYDRDGSVHSEEAEVVGELAARIIAGDSLRQLAFDLNRRGVRTSMGNEWTGNTVGQMICSPRLAGLRAHNGERYPGAWERIIDEDTHLRVLTALHRPHSVRRQVKRHLLTGLAVCGRCGGPLKTMGFVMRNGRSFPRYQCVKQPGHPNCGGTAASKVSMDAVVVDRLLDFLSSAELRPFEGENRRSALEQAIQEDGEAEKELTAAYFIERTMSREAYRTAALQLHERREQNVAAVAALDREEALVVGALRPGDREDLEKWWASASLEDQRAALRGAIERVVLHPAKRRGGNKFDASRVEVRWSLGLYYRRFKKWEETATDEDWRAAEEEYLRLRDEAEVEAEKEREQALRELLVDIGRRFAESQKMANGQTEQELHTVGTAGLLYFDEHGAGPADWATLMDAIDTYRSNGRLR